MFKIADRVLNLEESQTLNMSARAKKLKDSGVDIIDLSLGEPDFFTPDVIKSFAKQAIDENYSQYSPVPGYLDLRETICKKLKRDNGLDYLPGQIVVSTGAKHSLMNLFQALLDPGDQVIIPTPYWVSYLTMVQFSEGTPVTIRSTIENDYKITPSQLESAITNRTKIFIFSSPCNPTGSVYSRDELESLCEVFRKYPNILVISDEIYEYINFSGNQTSIASLDGMLERCVVVNGLSKGYAMTGWRLGYLAGPVEIASAVSKLQSQFTSGATSITQRAAISALSNNPQDISGHMREEFEKRRDQIYQKLSQIDGLRPNKPDGAFYFFPDVSSYFGKKYGKVVIENSDILSELILDVAHVSTVSGSAFGEPNCIRLSYATSIDKLIKAIERIEAFLKRLV
jgi:aspartate aminotransferase